MNIKESKVIIYLLPLSTFFLYKTVFDTVTSLCTCMSNGRRITCPDGLTFEGPTIVDSVLGGSGSTWIILFGIKSGCGRGRG